MSETYPDNRQGYHNVDRTRPSVTWADPPELPGSPEIDWEWVAEFVARYPGRWLRITHPIPGRNWGATAGRNVPHLAPFRPRGSHEAAVVNGYLYLRKRETSPWRT